MDNSIKMNLNFELCISSYIPKSLCIDGVILSNSNIAENAVAGIISLRESTIDKSKYIDENCFWGESIKNLSKLDIDALLGLNVLSNLQDEYNKSKNEKFYSTINVYLKSFLKWANKHLHIIDEFPETGYNRTYILIKLLLEYGEEWELNNLIRDFLYNYQLKFLISKKYIGGLAYQINSNITLMILSTLFNLNEEMSLSNKNLENILSEHFDSDGLAKESSLSKQVYYFKLLDQYIQFMMCYGKDDEIIFDKVNKGIDSLRILMKHDNKYPIIDMTYEMLGEYTGLNNSKWFKDKDICVFKNENIYCLYKCNSNTSVSHHCDCGSIVLSYMGRDIFVDSGHLINGPDDVKEYCKSSKGHSSVIFKSIDSIESNIYWKSINRKKTNITDVRISEDNTEFSCNSDILMNEGVINRYISFSKDILKINDVYDSKYSDEFQVRFVLHPDCKEVNINRNLITFFNRGLNIELKVSNYEYILKIELVKAYYCVSLNHFEESIAIVFTMKGQKGEADFNIKFINKYLDEYAENSKSFLDKKSELQIQKTLKSNLLNDIVSYCNIGSTELYRYGRQAYLNHDFETAKKCEILNSILHNCSIKSTCDIGKGTRLAYGGIGLLIHANSKIGKYCMVGANVTLAAAPTIEDFVYIATGARVIKPNCKIGSFCIIGANAVINKDIEPFSVVGGVPAKVIKKITPNNVERYLVAYLASTGKTDQKFIEYVRNEFYKTYNKHNNE